MKGTGRVTIGKETADIVAGDTIPVHPGEPHAFHSSNAELEFMIVGIAVEEDKLDTTVLSETAPPLTGRR
jgi:quercetin dioxygenase-like cupin family protein